MEQYKREQHLYKKGFIILLLILVVGLLTSGCQAQAPKTYRVGILTGLSFLADINDGFKAGMAELGYVEGENITYDVQTTEFDISAYQSILQKFVEDDVDLILVYPTEASIEAKNIIEGTDIPVLFTFALVEGQGLIDSIQEPGGNITGVRYPGPDIALRRFEVLHELVPDATRILIPYQKGYPIVQPQLDILTASPETEGITFVEAPVNNGAELAAFLQEQVESGEANIDAILLLAEPIAVDPGGIEAITNFASQYGIPFGGNYAASDGYRALFGVNVNLTESGKLAAPLAEKIFQGIDPGTIPVVSAEPYLEIDYKMAQQLGIEVPEGLLVLADEVYR